MKQFLFLGCFYFIFVSCEDISESYEISQEAVAYTATPLKFNPYPTDDIKLMSWNIRFGIGRANWFGDACGLNTLFDKETILRNLSGICTFINYVNPDILLVQECDIQSKRSAYVQQIQFILNRTKFNYAYYGPVWQSQFIPSHGLGKMDMGIVIFSKWPLTNTKRIQLPERSDQGSLENYFYLNYCMLKGDLTIPGFKTLTLFNVHSIAFATDDTKHKQYTKIKSELDITHAEGKPFVCGGDFNTLPPGATKVDYCMDDRCDGESIHGSHSAHKLGSNYSGESAWINGLFTAYNTSLPLSTYAQNEQVHFTHTTQHPYGLPNRRLEYFFTNHTWVDQTDTTYREAIRLSDHAPISVRLYLPK